MPLDHKQIVLTAVVNKPTTDCAFVSDWLKRIVLAIKMNIKIGPCVEYVNVPGNEGITSIVCIETSHIAFHCWDKEMPPHIKFDLYSCSTFDISAIIPFIMEFDPYFYEWILIDRNDGIKIIDKNGKQCKPIIDILDAETKKNYLDSKKIKDSILNEEQKKSRCVYNKMYSLYSLKGSVYRRKHVLSHASTINCIKQRSKKKNLPFDLTVEWYEKTLEESIKKYPKMISHQSGNKDLNFWLATVDRIVPKNGYLQNNCRIIPNALNCAKNKWNKNQLNDLCQLLKEDLEN